MPRRKPSKKPIKQYRHAGKQRANNPPVGLVDPNTDPDQGETQPYAYDPHLDPQLHWAGKAERTTFDVPTVSLHVHERIDPRTIMEAVRKRNGNGSGGKQASLFEEERDIPLRQAIEFYKHSHNWSNRMIAGDSLLVMNSLLQKENLAGKVQCVYMDPPYGIKYGSNFQPFVNKRDVQDGQDDDLTAEPEMIKAFRDTWELGIHSYLSYMRDRLLLARELLAESGSVFVQIGDENVHRTSMILDDIFGAQNRMATITFATTSGSSTSHLPQVADYLLWYAKDKERAKYRRLYEPLTRTEIAEFFTWHAMVELPDGICRKLTDQECLNPDKWLPKNARIYRRTGLDSQGASITGRSKPYKWSGRMFHCPPNRQWSISKEGMDKLAELSRLEALEGQDALMWKKYEEEVPGRRINNIWSAQMFAAGAFVVNTATKVIKRCLLMTTDPGDLVLDPTCGGGTTAFVAEQWGRRWITCDTSRVALSLARQRLMTADFDYYQLAHPDEGVGSGFTYKTVAKVSPKILANGEQHLTTLYDQPRKDTKLARVTGPFTVEAVPSPTVQPIDRPSPRPSPKGRGGEELPVAAGKGGEAFPSPAGRGIKGEGDSPAWEADASIARSGETLRQNEWRDELLKTGIRGKGGQRIAFSRVEPLPCRHLHADAETKPDDSGAEQVREPATAYKPRRAAVSFGPEHAPLEQRQVARALEEAQTLVPKPAIVVFAAFQFDPEAAKDIDETNWPGVTILKAQMNADIQNQDLKKKRAGNESFWLIGQPDVEVEQITDGEHAGQWQVEVQGFDYFNTRTGELESGGKNQIAAWMLDTDYDGMGLYPTQVFLPLADAKSGWQKLARNLKAEIDENLLQSYLGTKSLPFTPGPNNRIAVKIVDNRGVESLRVVDIEKC